MYKKKIAKIATISMLKELDLIDKPGLVSPVSNGSHDDMDYFLMRRGILSLRNYFEKAFSLGFFNSDFNALRELGKRYERKMFIYTGGINTHKGAVFLLGILVYLIARTKARGVVLSRENFLENIMAEIDKTSLKSLLKESRYGARREVIDGYSLSFESTKYSLDRRLYYIMSKIHDTNIVRRGGEELLNKVKQLSKFAINDHLKRRELKSVVESNRLSPGGAADILINSIFIEDFFKYEQSYLNSLKNSILSTKEAVADCGYNYKVVLSLVVPGLIKSDEKFLKYFERYKKIFDENYDIVKTIYNNTGYRTIYRLETTTDFVELKTFSIALENGSLIDIDIYKDEPIDRKYLKKPMRKCLLCDDAAKVCMINKTHSTEDIIKKSLEIINEN